MGGSTQGVGGAVAKARGATAGRPAADMLQDIPAHRIGQAAEVAAGAFLASPAAGCIGGTSPAVDGGCTGSL